MTRACFLKVICTIYICLSGFTGQAFAQVSTKTHQTIDTTNEFMSSGEWESARDFISLELESALADNVSNEDLLELSSKAREIYDLMEDAPRVKQMNKNMISVFEDRKYVIGQLTATIALADDLFWESNIDGSGEAVQRAILLYETNNISNNELYVKIHILRGLTAYKREAYSESLGILIPLFDEFKDMQSIEFEIRTDIPLWIARIYRDKAKTKKEESGDAEKSIAFARKAVELYEFEGQTNSVGYAIVLEGLSRVLWRYGNREESVPILRKSLTILEQKKLDKGRDYVLASSYMSNYLRKLKQHNEALVWARKSINVAYPLYLKRLASVAGVSRNDQVFLSFSSAIYFSALKENQKNGLVILDTDYEKLFSIAQLTTESSLAEAMKIASLAAAERDNALVVAVRQRKTLRDAWNKLNEKFRRASTGKAGDVRKISHIQKEMRAIQKKIDITTRTVGRKDAKFDYIWGYNALSIAKAQAVLKSNEAYIMFTYLYDSVHVFVITKEAFHWHESEFESGNDGVCANIVFIRNALSRQNKLRCVLGGFELESSKEEDRVFDPAKSHEFYLRMLSPANEVLVNKAHWIFSTTGMMSALPLGALVIDKPVKSDNDQWDYSNIKWLGREKAISLVPSANALYVSRQVMYKRKEVGKQKIVLAGSPCIGRYAGKDCDKLMRKEHQQRSSYADYVKTLRGAGSIMEQPEQIVLLTELPGAFSELSAVQNLLAVSSNKMIGSKFTEKAFRTNNWNEDILVVATHGLAAGDAGLKEPALIMSPSSITDIGLGYDGILTMSEISRMDIPLDWVILSGCSTANPSGQAVQDIFSGLALSFLQAGTQSLLVTHYEINDSVAAIITPLIIHTYKSNSDNNKGEALRGAIDALLSDTSQSHMHHPSNWSAYTVLGVAN